MKIIAIAGGSGSGKTTLANYLVEKNRDNSLLISLDNYYFNQEQQIEKNGFCNYDYPLALDKELLLKNLKELQTNGETLIPQYCFKQRDRIDYKKVQKSDILIIEGLYAVEFLKDTNAIKIFVEADNDLLLARRIKRDMENRGRKVEDILNQYFDDVKPAYMKYISTQKYQVEFLIDNNCKDISDFFKKFDRLKII